jgi:glycosyltransferase involved in cell wall biosynthesis
MTTKQSFSRGRQMRVLHVYAGNLFGGVETLLVTLAQHRDLCPEMQPEFALCFEGRLSKELNAAGAVVHALGNVKVSRPWTVWQARRRLGQVLARGRYEAVICHSCWPHAMFAPVVRACSVPLVFWSHDTPTGQHWLERWAGRTRPNLALANSRMTEAALPNLFPGVRSQVLFCPVSSPAAVGDRDGLRRSVRQALETPQNAVVIVQASRLERWKGHDLLLDALGRLCEVPGWACWIAGGAQRPHEQDYLEHLRHKAHELGVGRRVQFLGQRSDVPQLLAAADIHCQPNTGPEPFGIAFLEALYAGLPVVTTALGGALEIIEEDCGVLVPPGDGEALADALRRLVQDQGMRGRLGRAGPSRARFLCAPEAQIGKLKDLLFQLSHQEINA